MDISSIHFHDTEILRVIEDTATDILTMEVDYPVDWQNNKFEKRLLIFNNVLNYQVFEGPFHGCPTILEVSVVDTTGDRSRLRLETTAGYRELTCSAVKLIQCNDTALK